MLRQTAILVLLLTALCTVNSRPKEVPDTKDGPVSEKRFVDQQSLDERLAIEREFIDVYCESYLAGLERGHTRCGKDLHPHCLVNGTVVLGSCRIKRAVCIERILEDFDWYSCALF